MVSEKEFEALDPRKFIIIKGARAHNLKHVTVAIPRRSLTVITGLSGSGKSSLAFDTLYAEGQRRYVESLSAYARQFLGRLDKPEVDYIKGISPAIAIEQKVTTRSSRSTVGTSTEIYDYLKLLFARVGKTFSPVSGKEVKRHSVSDVVNYVVTLTPGTKFLVCAPLQRAAERSLMDELKILQQQGFSRIMLGREVCSISDALTTTLDDDIPALIVVDRLAVPQEEDPDFTPRLSDSVETSFFEGGGDCHIIEADTFNTQKFSSRFELDGLIFDDPHPNLFSFNLPSGACRSCEGFGSIIGIDPDLVIPNRSLSIYDDSIVPWKGEKMKRWKEKLVMSASEFDFPIHKPVFELSNEEYDLLWTGNKYFKGLNAFFDYLQQKSYKIQYRVMLSRYRGRTLCPECNGTRIRKEANYVKINGKSISELVVMPVSECQKYFELLSLTTYEKEVAKHLLKEIRNRLSYLMDVGLGYLTLNRLSNTLSGGESQRINLSTCLGSSLVGSMYILDEPSIGLHPRDTDRLIGVMTKLRDLGNTVIVVEHDEDIMKAADTIIDLGPRAGTRGGELVFYGTHGQLSTASESLTAKYLLREMEIPVPAKTRKSKDKIIVKGARQFNLKNVDVEIPLHCLTVVSGVSGSGKSTLIGEILYPALKRHLGEYSDKLGEFDGLEGDLNSVKAVEFVDQNPIGKSSRSNPVTYVKAYDDIRSLFAGLPLSKSRAYKPAHFSFNVAGGRCDECDGEGEVTVEMQFMADIKLKCDVCHGRRFKNEILEVTYRDKSIADILEMTVDDAIEFFSEEVKLKKLLNKLQPLQEVGLGYVQLGQASSTLSGGEAQRTKLAFYLSKGDRAEHTVFIFDEPTTGLHLDDVNMLMDSFNALLAQGHSIILIEHHLDVIKSADWVIDLGPDGGTKGGELVFAGTPDKLAENKSSLTALYLKDKFESPVTRD